MIDDPRVEIHHLIRTFDGLWGRIERLAEMPRRALCFSHRMMFREKYAELDALAHIIESRMEGLQDPWTRQARLEMNRLEAGCLMTARRALWAMVTRLETRTFLPLGARDLLDDERSTVQGLRNRAREPQLSQFLPDDLWDDLERIEQALAALIDRAHGLPSLEDGVLLYQKRAAKRVTGVSKAA